MNLCKFGAIKRDALLYFVLFPNKYFFNLQLLFFVIAFFCLTSWVILKQLDPSPSWAIVN